MKTKIIIFILVLFLGISGVVVVKSFADNNSDNSVADNNNKLQTSGPKSVQDPSFVVMDNIKDIEKNIPEDIYKSISRYLNDSDVYSCYITDYSYKIEIQKSLSKTKPKSKKEKANPRDVYFYASYRKNKPFIDLLNYKIPSDEKLLIFKDDNINIYDIPLKENDKNGILKLMLLTDKKNNIIWNIKYNTPPTLGTPTRILDIKKVNDDSYIVAFLPEIGIIIDYVHLDNEIPVVERYDMPFSTSGAAFSNPPISAKILKDDIIRLEYEDGAIEHWKIKQTKTDFDHNRKMSTKNNISAKDHALIWWNGVGKGNPYVNHINNKSWDYDDDTSTEPTYE